MQIDLKKPNNTILIYFAKYCKFILKAPENWTKLTKYFHTSWAGYLSLHKGSKTEFQ